MTFDSVKFVIAFSGKRKSGKDYITEKLNDRLHPKSQIIRISEPIKAEWSKRLQLDITKLLSDGPYKEKYRKEMIEWSDDVRKSDYGFFCSAALQSACKEILIISDVRRQSDIKYLKEIFGERMKTVRLVCSDDVRTSRGWTFQCGVDDVQSECDLDGYCNWDLVIQNDKNSMEEKILLKIENLLI